MILKKFKIPIYGGQLWVCVSASFLRAIESIEDSTDIVLETKQEKADLRKISATSYRFYDHNGKFRVIALIKPGATIDDVTHEALHILNWIFSHGGIRYDLRNDEPQCYLIGWISSKIWRVRNS